MGDHCLTGLGVSRAHWRSFKRDWREEKDKKRLTRGMCVGSMPKFGRGCASKILVFAISVNGDP